MTRRVWTAAVLLAVALAAAGCTPGDPEPEPTTSASQAVTPTPTTDPAEAQEEAAVAAATTALTALMQAVDEFAQGGYVDLGPLNGLVGGDLRTTLPATYEQSQAKGARQTGSTVLEDITLVEFQPGPSGGGREQVVLEACADSTGKDVVLPDGSSTLDPSFPKRLTMTYTVQNNDGHWTVDAVEPDAARPC